MTATGITTSLGQHGLNFIPKRNGYWLFESGDRNRTRSLMVPISHCQFRHSFRQRNNSSASINCDNCRLGDKIRGFSREIEPLRTNLISNEQLLRRLGAVKHNRRRADRKLRENQAWPKAAKQAAKPEVSYRHTHHEKTDLGFG